MRHSGRHFRVQHRWPWGRPGLGKRDMILSVEREKAIKSSRIANNMRANHANVLSVEQEKKHSLSMAASEKKLQALAAAERARREEEARQKVAALPQKSSKQPPSSSSSKDAPAASHDASGGATAPKLTHATVIAAHADGSADIKLPNGEIIYWLHPTNLMHQPPHVRAAVLEAISLVHAQPPPTASSSLRPDTSSSRRPQTASSQASTASSARTHESLQERAIQQRTAASDRLKRSVATSLSREKAVEEENDRLEAELEHKLAERAAFQQSLQQVRAGTNRVSFGMNLTTLPFEADTENRDRNTATPAEKTKNGTPIDEQLATLEIGGRRRGGQMTLGAVRSSQSEISSLLSWS